MRLRVASWNVQSFRGGVDAAAGVLHPLAVDLALLQECGSKRSLARFAEELDMELVSSHRLFRPLARSDAQDEWSVSQGSSTDIGS